MDYQKIERIADRCTFIAMEYIFGDKFINTDNIEADEEMNNAWEQLNDKFFSALNEIINESK